MTITTDHPASSYGIAIFLDDRGKPIDYKAGVKLLRKRLGYRSAKALAAALDLKEKTVQDWELGRLRPGPKPLWKMREMLAKAPTRP